MLCYGIKLAGEYKLDVGLIISALTWLLPQLFEAVSLVMERYSPPVFMKWQLVRVFVLYVANLASLLWSLMDTINKDMHADADSSGHSHETEHLEEHHGAETQVLDGGMTIIPGMTSVFNVSSAVNGTIIITDTDHHDMKLPKIVEYLRRKRGADGDHGLSDCWETRVGIEFIYRVFF